MVKGMGIVVFFCGIAVMLQDMELLGLVIVCMGAWVFWFAGNAGGDR